MRSKRSSSWPMRRIWPESDLLLVGHLHEHAVEAVEVADHGPGRVDHHLGVERRQVAVVLEHRTGAAAELVLAVGQLVDPALAAVGTDQGQGRVAPGLGRLEGRGPGSAPWQGRRRAVVHAEAAGAAEPEVGRHVVAARRAAAHAPGRRRAGREPGREARDARRRAHRLRGGGRRHHARAAERPEAASRASRRGPAAASARSDRAGPPGIACGPGSAIMVFIIPTSPPGFGRGSSAPPRSRGRTCSGPGSLSRTGCRRSCRAPRFGEVDVTRFRRVAAAAP